MEPDKMRDNRIEDFGYGNGYIYSKEEFGRLLNLLGDVVKAGVNIVLTAHAQIRKFEQPDELGAYDRYELKLGKKTGSHTSPLIKEWADMVLFANYKTYSVAVDDKGKKHKAQGGTRVMYTSHHPCWDAKNRFGLPSELPFEFASISKFFGQLGSSEEKMSSNKSIDWKIRTVPASQKEEKQSIDKEEVEKEEVKKETIPNHINTDNKIPKPLADLMQAHEVSVWDIQGVVAARGYYPSDTPIENYDPAFISGVLVGAWPQVHEMILGLREEIPF